jgi:hypothetical protein
MNPYELMRRAGHADFATTMRYIHMAGPKAKDAEVSAQDVKRKASKVQGGHKSGHRSDFVVFRGKRTAGNK